MNSDDDELFIQISSQDPGSTRKSLSPSNKSDVDDIGQIDEEYIEYGKTDPIRRFQFDYDEKVALANELLSAQMDGDALTRSKTTENRGDNFIHVAPGEGQILSSVLKDKDVDIKTFPHLFPD